MRHVPELLAAFSCRQMLLLVGLAYIECSQLSWFCKTIHYHLTAQQSA